MKAFEEFAKKCLCRYEKKLSAAHCFLTADRCGESNCYIWHLHQRISALEEQNERKP